MGPPFFLAIVAPLLIALATIRMLVYGLRRMFKTQSWLPTSERAIALAIFALVVLYFLGLFPEIANTLDEIQLPLGKTQISLLSIGTAVLVGVLVDTGVFVGVVVGAGVLVGVGVFVGVAVGPG